MKLNYIIIPLIAIATAAIGSLFTNQGLSSWYKTINLPSWTPPGAVIGLVWTIIYILTAVSAILIWNRSPRPGNLALIAVLFLFNALLNAGWSYLFFSRHLVGTAVAEAVLLGLSVIALIIYIWPHSRLAATLLIPYAAWVIFATYLTYSVWSLNK